MDPNRKLEELLRLQEEILVSQQRMIKKMEEHAERKAEKTKEGIWTVLREEK